jgi:hypothetical protein
MSALVFQAATPDATHGRGRSDTPDATASPSLTWVRALAAASTLCLLAMLGISWSTGLNVQHFEHVSTPTFWAESFLAHAQPLRWLTVFDDVFVACYVGTTLLLVQRLRAEAPNGARMHALGPWVVAAAVAVGLLDLVENHHVLSLLHAVEQGQPIDHDTLVAREWLSSVKWLLGHVAFCLLGVALWFDTWPWRLFRVSLIAWQLPVGAAALALASTSGLGEALGWLKLLNVLGGFLALATLPWPDHSEPSPAPTEPSANG